MCIRDSYNGVFDYRTWIIGPPLSLIHILVEETPICRLASFEVPAPYPRTRACLTEPRMLALRERLIGMLRREVAV